jgi:hypothetical protein
MLAVVLTEMEHRMFYPVAQDGEDQRPPAVPGVALAVGQVGVREGGQQVRQRSDGAVRVVYDFMPRALAIGGKAVSILLVVCAQGWRLGILQRGSHTLYRAQAPGRHMRNDIFGTPVLGRAHRRPLLKTQASYQLLLTGARQAQQIEQAHPQVATCH